LDGLTGLRGVSDTKAKRPEKNRWRKRAKKQFVFFSLSPSLVLLFSESTSATTITIKGKKKRLLFFVCISYFIVGTHRALHIRRTVNAVPSSDRADDTGSRGEPTEDAGAKNGERKRTREEGTADENGTTNGDANGRRPREPDCRDVPTAVTNPLRSARTSVGAG